MSTSRQSIQTLADDLESVLSDLSSAEQLAQVHADIVTSQNAQISQMMAQIAAEQAQIAEKDATIAAKDAEIDALSETLGILHDDYDALREQLRLASFTVLNEMKSSGQIPGWPDILVIYEQDLIAPGETGLMPPNEAFLRTKFAQIKAANPNAKRVCLDKEACWDSAGKIADQFIAHYVRIIEIALEFWDDAGPYSTAPRRYSAYLNYPVGHPSGLHESRLAEWEADSVRLQPIFDVATTLFVSLYPINPCHNNAANRDAWTADNLRICRERAPGKRVIAFMMARVHPSADPAKPYLSGLYFRAWLETVKSVGYDGLVIYQNTTDPDPFGVTPSPDWLVETQAFRAAL